MISTKRIGALVASGALAVSVAIAAPAGAANYAPGLPAATPGVPNNPPAAAPVAPAVTTVSQSVADDTRARVMKRPSTPAMGEAPKVRRKINKPIALVANGLTAGATYQVYIKKNGQEYGLLGSVIGSEFSALPVFEVSRAGTYTIAMKNVQTGATQYIKVRARK